MSRRGSEAKDSLGTHSQASEGETVEQRIEASAWGSSKSQVVVFLGSGPGQAIRPCCVQGLENELASNCKQLQEARK